MRKRYTKFISILLVFLFIWQDIVWANPDALSPYAALSRVTESSARMMVQAAVLDELITRGWDIKGMGYRLAIIKNLPAPMGRTEVDTRFILEEGTAGQVYKALCVFKSAHISSSRSYEFLVDASGKSITSPDDIKPAGPVQEKTETVQPIVESEKPVTKDETVRPDGKNHRRGMTTIDMVTALVSLSVFGAAAYCLWHYPLTTFLVFMSSGIAALAVGFAIYLYEQYFEEYPKLLEDLRRNAQGESVSDINELIERLGEAYYGAHKIVIRVLNEYSRARMKVMYKLAADIDEGRDVPRALDQLSNLFKDRSLALEFIKIYFHSHLEMKRKDLVLPLLKEIIGKGEPVFFGKEYADSRIIETGKFVHKKQIEIKYGIVRNKLIPYSEKWLKARIKDYMRRYGGDFNKVMTSWDNERLHDSLGYLQYVVLPSYTTKGLRFTVYADTDRKFAGTPLAWWTVEKLPDTGKVNLNYIAVSLALLMGWSPIFMKWGIRDIGGTAMAFTIFSTSFVFLSVLAIGKMLLRPSKDKIVVFKHLSSLEPGEKTLLFSSILFNITGSIIYYHAVFSPEIFSLVIAFAFIIINILNQVINKLFLGGSMTKANLVGLLMMTGATAFSVLSKPNGAFTFDMPRAMLVTGMVFYAIRQMLQRKFFNKLSERHAGTELIDYLKGPGIVRLNYFIGFLVCGILGVSLVNGFIDPSWLSIGGMDVKGQVDIVRDFGSLFIPHTAAFLASASFLLNWQLSYKILSTPDKKYRFANFLLIGALSATMTTIYDSCLHLAWPAIPAVIAAAISVLGAVIGTRETKIRLNKEQVGEEALGTNQPANMPEYSAASVGVCESGGKTTISEYGPVRKIVNGENFTFPILRDMRDEKELAYAILEKAMSIARSNPDDHVTLAFQKDISDISSQKVKKMLRELAKKTEFEPLLRKVVIIDSFKNTDDLAKKLTKQGEILEARGIASDKIGKNILFTFAPATAQFEVKGVDRLAETSKLVFVNGEGFDKDIYYYPIAEIVAATLTVYLHEMSSQEITEAINKASNNIGELNIKEIADGSDGAFLIFTLLERVRAIPVEHELNRYKKVGNAIDSAA